MPLSILYIALFIIVLIIIPTIFFRNLVLIVGIILFGLIILIDIPIYVIMQDKQHRIPIVLKGLPIRFQDYFYSKLIVTALAITIYYFLPTILVMATAGENALRLVAEFFQMDFLDFMVTFLFFPTMLVFLIGFLTTIFALFMKREHCKILKNQPYLFLFAALYMVDPSLDEIRRFCLSTGFKTVAMLIAFTGPLLITIMVLLAKKAYCSKWAYQMMK